MTHTRKSPVRLAVKHTILVGVALVMIYPVVWLISSSFKPNQEIFTSVGLIPTTLTTNNYSAGWEGAGTPFGVYLINSFIICTFAVVGNVIACSMAAYVFARLKFRGRGLLFGVMLMTIMLPHQVTLVPQYSIFLNLGWINTFLPLIIPKFLAVDAFFIFLMVQFIRSIPREIDEAAEVDGAGPIAIYLRMILPLMSPALVTTAIFTFIWTYDDLLSQLIYLNEPSVSTVPLGLRAFLDVTSTSNWGAMFAMAVLSLLVPLVIFVVFQRRLVEGLATTGLKG